jgi:hypothetical protein
VPLLSTPVLCPPPETGYGYTTSTVMGVGSEGGGVVEYAHNDVLSEGVHVTVCGSDPLGSHCGIREKASVSPAVIGVALPRGGFRAWYQLPIFREWFLLFCYLKVFVVQILVDGPKNDIIVWSRHGVQEGNGTVVEVYHC